MKAHQLCSNCGDRTGRCEDDSLYIDDGPPLCESCYDDLTKHDECDPDEEAYQRAAANGRLITKNGRDVS